MKKYLWLGGFIIGTVFLAGCTQKTTTKTTDIGETSKSAAVTEPAGKCQPGEVAIEGYGDKGKRLSNCFVEYPGEPTREDKSYYVVEDICGQFTKEFIQNLLGKTIIEARLPQVDGIYNCTYYWDEKNYLMLNLEYLKIDNQKAFYERGGAKIEKNPQIPMENLVVWEKPDLISVIYLVLDPEKFISIRPADENTISSTDFLNFAGKLGEEIKNYK